MKKIIVLFICQLFITSALFANDPVIFKGHGYKCATHISDIEALTYQTVNKAYWDIKYYYRENDKIEINGMEFKQISYIFFKDQYLGYIVYINDKEKKSNVKKYLLESNKYLLEAKPEKCAWQTDNEIITYQSFSTHQAKVVYLCKEMYSKITPKPY